MYTIGTYLKQKKLINARKINERYKNKITTMR